MDVELIEVCGPGAERPSEVQVVLPARERARRTSTHNVGGGRTGVCSYKVQCPGRILLVPVDHIRTIQVDLDLTPIRARKAQRRVDVDAGRLDLRDVDVPLDCELDRAWQATRRL